MKAIITIGLPGCGKTTYVRDYFSGYFNINLDDIRAQYCPDGLLDWRVFDFEKYEAEVASEMGRMLDEVMENKSSFVLSNTNISLIRLDDMLRRIRLVGYIITIIDFTQMPLEKVLHRNKSRLTRLVVDEEVIINMHARLEAKDSSASVSSICSIYADTIHYVR